MTDSILTNIELHQIEQQIETISMAFDTLNPEVFDDAEKIARYEEILAYYESLLQSSFKKVRISESGLKLVV